MKLRAVWEHNGKDTLLYACDFPGAFSRGCSLAEAAVKLPGAVAAWAKWAGMPMEKMDGVEVVQDRESGLNIRDADSDVLFDSERLPLTAGEYGALKALVMKSAHDFQLLYDAIGDGHASDIPERTTFYGPVPRSAEEMYRHTKQVNEYYFWEIGVDADNEGTIAECRARGFEKLEQAEGYLQKGAVTGSYGEEWSLRKLLRRFLWHDRIHARAMYRMAVRMFGPDQIPDPFYFETERGDTYGMA